MKRVLRQDRPQGEYPEGHKHPEGHKRLAAYPMRVLVPLLLIVVLAAIAVAGYWLNRPAEAQAVACTDPVAGCRFSHRGATVTAYFSAHPKPLEAFRFSVNAPGATRVSAEFQMNGMEMGFNRYDLHPSDNDTFVSSVTLPVCVSGRRDWTLYLEIDGVHYALPFSTR
ncbi:hypothetical protein [Thiobacillus sp.]